MIAIQQPQKKLPRIRNLTTMAIHRTDRKTEIMEEEFGTICLATDPAANRYLDRISQRKDATPPADSLSRWCGGKGGFDLYSERLYE